MGDGGVGAGGSRTAPTGEKMGPRIREDTEGVTPILTFPRLEGRVKR